MNRNQPKTDRRSYPRKNKALGQVFLKDDWPCVRMASGLKNQGITHVLEIGPGGGALTKHLLKAGLHVTCVEKDTRFAEILEEKKEELTDVGGSLLILNEDILKFDLQGWLIDKPFSVAVCGNIPYNISSPILIKVLPLLSRLVTVCFLVQLEFGQRVCAEPGSKNYGSLSVFSQLRALTNLDFVVSKRCFTPIPKVDSAVISMKKPIIKFSEQLLQKTETVTRQAFTMRRKKLSNAMAKFLNSKDLNLAPINLDQRPDVTTPKQFVEMTKFIFDIED